LINLDTDSSQYFKFTLGSATDATINLDYSGFGVNYNLFTNWTNEACPITPCLSSGCCGPELSGSEQCDEGLGAETYYIRVDREGPIADGYELSLNCMELPCLCYCVADCSVVGLCDCSGCPLFPCIDPGLGEPCTNCCRTCIFEICDDSTDNDGDGDVDCDDSDCIGNPDCDCPPNSCQDLLNLIISLHGRIDTWDIGLVVSNCGDGNWCENILSDLTIPCPVASFTSSGETVYTGELITFNAGSSYDPDGSIVSYDWDFGDGTTDSGVIVSHSWSASGSYTVTLTVTDDDGVTDSVSSSVDIS
jgi:hypothetical protein